MNSAAPRSALWRRPFESWLDGVEAGWAIPAFILTFVAVWMTFLIVGYQNGDLHPDVLESWTLGRELAWGNPKHPPLIGWIARAWTSVFPLTDWSMHLLAMLNSALALWFIDLTGRRFVSGDKRAVIMLLLIFLPAYQFHAERFNANSILLSTWAIAIYCFLRSFETLNTRWAIAAGAAAALAMMGKYYSVFLIAGFVVAAIAHPRRRDYLFSMAPWVSTLTGLILLGPHLWWLATTGFTPYEYAMVSHRGLPTGIAVWEAVKYVLSNLGYLILPLAIWCLMIRAHLARFAQDLTKLQPGLLLFLYIFLATVFIPPIVSVALGSDLPPIWNLQAVFLAVLVAVAAVSFKVERFDSVNLAAATALFFVTALIAAPIHAYIRNTVGFDWNRNFLSAAAKEMTLRWHQYSDTPFEAVSGDDALAFATAFYSPDHPHYKRPFQFQYTWGLPRRTTLDKGWAAMCFYDDPPCLDWLNQVAKLAGSVVRTEFELQASLWGQPGVSTKIVGLIAPPLKEPAVKPANPKSGSIQEFSAKRHNYSDIDKRQLR
ncbi:MAG: glycosyltransferase family 39 protein [Rhizobiales bacterium]|nr:glycosyltransferase family 39 protein [Hyphomicrobiales bacterium]